MKNKVKFTGTTMGAEEFVEYWNKHYPQNEKSKKVLRKNTNRDKDSD